MERTKTEFVLQYETFTLDNKPTWTEWALWEVGEQYTEELCKGLALQELNRLNLSHPKTKFRIIKRTTTITEETIKED